MTNTIDASIRDEARDRYLTYALSVISGRALPDVRDGLKPVQRRILFAMLHLLNLTPEKSYRKSASVVGQVLASLHPHGDVPCYEALVRMAQDFSLRYPLVDGQGNFGSIDGDGAAAYRYTEAKLRAFALEVTGELYEETVDFKENFDSTLQEPTVLPSRVPNLLVNGSAGIAVGMATNIPPHNLKEVCEALLVLLDDDKTSEEKLAKIVKAPDFPTGCLIMTPRKELEEIYKTGRGTIRMRSDWEVEDAKYGKRNIIITSVPYGVNKAAAVEVIGRLIGERKVPQLNDVRDESTTDVRVVLELAPGASAEAAMAYLFKHTTLDSNFIVNFTALVPTDEGGLRPEQLSLKRCLEEFLKFRFTVVTKKLQFERKELLARLEILEGLLIVLDALDEAIKIVRKSEGRADSAEKLQKRFGINERQSLAVVDMRIYQLSRTSIEEIRLEAKEKRERVAAIEKLLKSPASLWKMVRSDIERVQKDFGDARRCKLAKESAEVEYDAQAYVVHEDVHVIVTRDGWLKRIRQNNDPSATRVREGDAILNTHPVSTREAIAFFTSEGNLFIMSAMDIPASSGYGEPIQKLLKFGDGELIVATYALKGTDSQQEFLGKQFERHDVLTPTDKLVLASKKGVGFVALFADLSVTKRNGRRAMKLRDGDTLVGVTKGAKYVACVTRLGSGLVVATNELPERDSPVVGVQLMSVRDDDALIGIRGVEKGDTVVLRLDGGKTKESPIKEWTFGHRGLKGTKVVPRGEILGLEGLSN